MVAFKFAYKLASSSITNVAIPACFLTVTDIALFQALLLHFVSLISQLSINEK